MVRKSVLQFLEDHKSILWFSLLGKNVKVLFFQFALLILTLALYLMHDRNPEQEGVFLTEQCRHQHNDKVAKIS